MAEVLTARDGELPRTVSDSVIARLARLPPRARSLVEAVAIVPSRAEIELVRALVGDGAEPTEEIEDCVAAGLLEPLLQAVLDHPHPWQTGEVVIWLWRAGSRRVSALDGPEASVVGAIASPYAAEIRGDRASAAAAWEEIGSPYERALALAGGDGAARRRALRLLEGLGARPAVERLRAGR